MDLLSGISRDHFSIFIWALMAVFVISAFALRPKRLHWTALGAAFLFAALNAGVGVYVLNHYTDPRWSPQATRLSAPNLGDTPMVGQFMGPLDSTLSSLVTGVNDFLSFKDALPVAMDFFTNSGWALAVSIPLGITATIINFALSKRKAATVEKYRKTVDLLEGEVENLKIQFQTMTRVDTLTGHINTNPTELPLLAPMSTAQQLP